jgi:acetyl-CoA carboxylase biotin carboxyl carrier protein
VELTNDDVADILALLDSLPYDELDLRTDRFRLTLRRTPSGTWTEERQALSSPTPVTPATDGNFGVAGASGSGVAAGDADGLATVDRLVAVVAPLPGTFYRAPRPGAPPFVQIGDEVGADTVVAIVETMKLMNSVHAGTAGRVAAILAGNGEVVAQGAALIRIEPEQA